MSTTTFRTADVGSLGAFVALGASVPDVSSSTQNAAIAILFTLPALALLLVCTRTIGRAVSNQFGWDDGLILMAMVLSLAETAASYAYIKTSFIGISPADVPPHVDPRPGRQWDYAVQILYNPILGLAKASALLLLRRLFGRQAGFVRRFVAWLGAANAAHMVAVLGAVAFQCAPVARFWEDPAAAAPGGRCVDQRALYTVVAAVNILTDLLVLGLPLWIFLDLKIPSRTKAALMVIFLLGFLVTIASIVRLVLLVQGIFMLGTIIDVNGSIGFVTSAIETNLAIITASAPALRPLFRAWFPRKRLLADRGEGAEEAADEGEEQRHKVPDDSMARHSLRSSQELVTASTKGIIKQSDVYIEVKSQPGYGYPGDAPKDDERMASWI
ncbi:hypothetical protein GGR56DRAFT_687269 [Xylariaceae sp. FL0804]|nr:hypothetical protein GGR56DRAFT_687269 [Xylariaceae sp. FL0804]